MSIMNDNESSEPPSGASKSKRKAGPPAAKKRKFYKKAPQAPKRFKSAFIFFSTAKHREIREQMEKGEIKDSEKTISVAKQVSEAWKKLNDEERYEWEELSRKDKIRYEAEKAAYSGPWRVQTAKRTAKDPRAPKRPMSAFLAYSNCRRAGLKRKDPTLSNAEVSRILSKSWKEAPQEVRQKYIDEEFELRQKYKVANAKYREEEELKRQEEREQREKHAVNEAVGASSSLSAAVGVPGSVPNPPRHNRPHDDQHRQLLQLSAEEDFGNNLHGEEEDGVTQHPLPVQRELGLLPPVMGLSPSLAELASSQPPPPRLREAPYSSAISSSLLLRRPQNHLLALSGGLGASLLPNAPDDPLVDPLAAAYGTAGLPLVMRSSPFALPATSLATDASLLATLQLQQRPEEQLLAQRRAIAALTAAAVGAEEYSQLDPSTWGYRDLDPHRPRRSDDHGGF